MNTKPSEFTFTALAGTPLRDIAATLAENRQYLPFDPPLVERGATIGGTVAAGLTGPGGFRFGTLRDFLLGLQFVDGNGEVLRSGGKVVKNAAGFDFHKFLVGSLGQFGVISELTFKVFPAKPESTTLIWSCGAMRDAVDLVQELSRGGWELDALEIDATEYRVIARLCGNPEALENRATRLKEAMQRHCDALTQAEAERFWRKRNGFALGAVRSCDGQNSGHPEQDCGIGRTV